MIPEKNMQGLVHEFKGKRILVLGDLVLDHYLEGAVSRISPEAPVPVISLEDNCERWIPGGAANVALNVLSLGGTPVMAGVAGNDREGEILVSLLADAGVDVDAVVIDTDRPTTVKTRVTSRNQQLMRIDREKTHFINGKIHNELVSRIDSVSDTVNSFVIEDYDKGVLSKPLIDHVINSAVAGEKYLAVDPKNRNFWDYVNCSLFKPNRHEAGFALGISIEGVEKAIDAALEIKRRMSAEAVLITLGSRGSVLVHGSIDSPQHQHLPTVARHVFDVSGAGDSVIAVMGLAGACGISAPDAARLANLAAAAVCAEPGVYAVKPEDILREASRFE